MKVIKAVYNNDTTFINDIISNIGIPHIFEGYNISYLKDRTKRVQHVAACGWQRLKPRLYGSLLDRSGVVIMPWRSAEASKNAVRGCYGAAGKDAKKKFKCRKMAHEAKVWRKGKMKASRKRSRK